MSELVIVSYNIHRSPTVWATLVNSPALRRVDVLLLQEAPAHLSALPIGWHLLLPPLVTFEIDEQTHPRSIMLVNPRFPTPSMLQMPIPSRDVVGIDLHINEEESVRIIGVYNPCAGGRSPANRSIREVLPTVLTASCTHHPLVVAGDFNLHHPEWDSTVPAADDKAEEARLTFEEAGLVHLLETDVPTWYGSGSSYVLDLALGNLQAEERLVSSCIDESLECGSDHRPIRVVLSVARPEKPPSYPRRLFRKADPHQILLAYARLEALAPRPPPLLTEHDIDNEATHLADILREVVSEAVPLAKPSRSRFAHWWWSADVAAAVDEARVMRNRLCREKAAAARRGGVAPERSEKAAKMARNKARAVIRREKRRAERTEVEEVDEASLWKVVKNKLGGGSAPAATPPLKRDDGTYATSPLDKLGLLQPVLLPVVEGGEEEAADEDLVSLLQVGHPKLRVATPKVTTSQADDRHASEQARTPAGLAAPRREAGRAKPMPKPRRNRGSQGEDDEAGNDEVGGDEGEAGGGNVETSRAARKEEAGAEGGAARDGVRAAECTPAPSARRSTSASGLPARLLRRSTRLRSTSRFTRARRRSRPSRAWRRFSTHLSPRG